MRESDALDNNPHVSRSALEAIHSQVFGWALSRCNFERAPAEDLVQQAYVELLSGNARFNNQSSLKTFVFAVVQNLAKSRYRRLATRLRLMQQYTPAENTVDAREPVDVPDHSGSNQVWLAVRELPARQRDIIELVFCRRRYACVDRYRARALRPCEKGIENKVTHTLQYRSMGG